MPPYPADCPFCHWLHAPSPELGLERLAETDHALILLGRWQFYRGYCLVVGKRHVRELPELPPDELAGYLKAMTDTAAVILDEFRPHKLNYELLGNQVEHPHWHLFPRSADDPDRLKAPWVALERAETDGAWRDKLEARSEHAGIAERLKRRLNA